MQAVTYLGTQSSSLHLQHCLLHCLFSSVLMLPEPCPQFSPSPNGKVRDISDAKKRALAGNDIFNNNQVRQYIAQNRNLAQVCTPLSPHWPAQACARSLRSGMAG